MEKCGTLWSKSTNIENPTAIKRTTGPNTIFTNNFPCRALTGRTFDTIECNLCASFEAFFYIIQYIPISEFLSNKKQTCANFS